MVDTDENDWEGFEPDVEEGVDKADVNIESEYDRLLEVEREGAHEGIDGVITGRHRRYSDFWSGHDRRVSGSLAETAGATVKDVRRGGLGEEKEEQDESCG